MSYLIFVLEISKFIHYFYPRICLIHFSCKSLVYTLQAKRMLFVTIYAPRVKKHEGKESRIRFLGICIRLSYAEYMGRVWRKYCMVKKRKLWIVKTRQGFINYVWKEDVKFVYKYVMNEYGILWIQISNSNSDFYHVKSLMNLCFVPYKITIWWCTAINLPFHYIIDTISVWKLFRIIESCSTDFSLLHILLG